MKIALFGKNPVNGNDNFLETLLKQLQGRGSQIFIYKSWGQPALIARENGIPCESFDDHTGLAGIDFLLSIGGDGTLLDTLPLVHDSGIPVLGINLGRLGFLSAVGRDEAETALDCIFNDKINFEPRVLLKLEMPDYNGYPYALNEISIQKELPASMLSVKTWIDGEFLNNYWADGLIVATPTGSTAYSLSCGGPIIAPHSENFVITPIANHNLTVRPVVVPDESRITIRVDEKAGRFILGLDSRILPVRAGSEIIISKAGFGLNLVRLPSRNFYTTLRAKLTWGHDIRN
jgi:NAD+ kinase